MKHIRFSVLGIVATGALWALPIWAQPVGQSAPPAPAAAPPPSGPATPGPGAAPAPPPESPPGLVPVAPGPPPSGPPASAGTNPFYEQAPPPQQPATIHVEQPEPPPLEPRNRHYHDGFYLRISTGFGYQGVSSSVGDSSVTTSGAGFALDVLMGGTPVPGLVIGGGSVFQTAVSPGQSDSGRPVPGLASKAPGGVGLWLLGPMVDVFPNPNHGFHFGALLGLAAIGLTGKDDKLSGGGGVSAWLGYGDWAAAQWSLGGLIRFTGAGTKRTLAGPPEVDATDGAWGVTAEISATYH